MSSTFGISVTELLLLLFTPLGGFIGLGLAALIAASVLGTDRTGLHRGAVLARWAGLLVGGGAGLVMLQITAGSGGPDGRLGLGALTPAAPLAAGALTVLAIMLGELTLPASAGDRRIGLLAHRGLATVAPRLPLILSTGVTAFLLLLTTVTTATAAPDDMGRPGRSFAWDNGVVGDGAVSGASGPYPGQWYTIPTWCALAVLAVATALGITVVIRRRPSLDAEDLLIRRRSVTSLLGAAAAGAGVSLLGLAATTVLACSDAALQWDAYHDLAAVLGFGLGLASLLVGLAGVVAGMAMACFPAAFARRGTRRAPGAEPIR